MGSREKRKLGIRVHSINFWSLRGTERERERERERETDRQTDRLTDRHMFWHIFLKPRSPALVIYFLKEDYTI